MSTPPAPQPPSGQGPEPHHPAFPSSRPVWGAPAHGHPVAPGYAYGYPVAPGFSGFAVASLLVGLLCLPPLGIVFGVIALVRTAGGRERGRALAVVGLTVSTAMTGVLVLGVVPRLGGYLDRAAVAIASQRPAGRPVDSGALGVGDCFNVEGGDLFGADPRPYRIACEEVHDAEVTFAGALPLAGTPEDSALDRAARDRCWMAEDDYVRDTWALPADVQMVYYGPSEEDWRDGYERLVCVLGTPDGEHRGSLRVREDLTPEQTALTNTLNKVDRARLGGPDPEVENALAEYREWAGRVETELGREARLLGEPVEPAASAAAAAQSKAVEASRAHWRRAARATGAKEFREAWDAARAPLDPETEKALRGAFGLATTVPEWLSDYAEGSGPDEGAGPSSESI
ncbi:DUF4190 domain-containing protein [Streptomyces sp. NPDC101733]|uniref:DUF4190 domain-containing protein n=1 Tax=unclassified Streptomyces TaxID=2593676 RepID=UPI003818AEC3